MSDSPAHANTPQLEAERPGPREPLALLAVTALVLAWSAVQPFDRVTWWLEIAPVLVAAPLLVATYARLRFSTFAYRLMFLHACLLIVGAHFTYEHVPLGDWVRDAFGLARNHYDRLGHLAQGFVPAILAREMLLRCTPLRRGGWLFALAVCIPVSISSFYEMLEWWAALIGDDGAASFLGTQGDVWDTQWDMFLALLGALGAQLAFARVHDRSLRAVVTETHTS